MPTPIDRDELRRLLHDEQAQLVEVLPADEYEDDPQLQARDFFRVLEQPGLEPMTVDNAPFRSERIPEPACGRAPELGEHTREVCAELLGMNAAEVDRLIASGVLEQPGVIGGVNAGTG